MSGIWKSIRHFNKASRDSSISSRKSRQAQTMQWNNSNLKKVIQSVGNKPFLSMVEKRHKANFHFCHYRDNDTCKVKKRRWRSSTWIMPTSLAPSPMARVMASFTCCLTSFTTCAFCKGETLNKKQAKVRVSSNVSRENKKQENKTNRKRWKKIGYPLKPPRLNSLHICFP